eukprot:Amastigsp_a841514_22.p4 type:complete len:105 gc:universal Amastigsp_a841514_22:486-800(+)
MKNPSRDLACALRQKSAKPDGAVVRTHTCPWYHANAQTWRLDHESRLETASRARPLPSTEPKCCRLQRALRRRDCVARRHCTGAVVQCAHTTSLSSVQTPNSRH